MSNKDYLKDLSEIKNLMNKSSRFISLSGLSGILAGIYAIVGAAAAYWLVVTYSNGTLLLDGWIFRTVLLILISIAALSAVTGIILTTNKAKKNGEKIWDSASKRLVINFLIPLIVGGGLYSYHTQSTKIWSNWCLNAHFLWTSPYQCI